MKNARHDAIREIISVHSVGTQAELRELLEQRGIEVTQATLSRDINELGIIKLDERYTISETTSAELPPLLMQAVTGVDHAGYTVVFHCHAGMANAACATFDRLKLGSVVGTIAGDDTIFILMRTEKEAEVFSKKMRSVILSGKGDFNAQ